MAKTSTKTIHAVENEICDKFGYSDLKSSQKEFIAYFNNNNNDIFVCLPTGEGKSVLFQSMFIIKDLNISEDKIVVFEPLISIMKEHVRDLKLLGYKAMFIGEEDSSVDNMKKNQFIYCAPEVLGEKKWRDAFEELSSNIKYIVVDEAHTVVNWGRSKKKAFREWFDNINEIRSLCCNAKVLAFTATASKVQKKEIMKSLSMPKSTKQIVKSPDRSNIQLNVIKVDCELTLDQVFSFLIEDIMNLGSKMPRYIIFCHNRKAIASIYDSLQLCDVPKKFFNMYHYSNSEEVKDLIREELDDPYSNLRILIASNSAGMGVNLSGVNHVIHYGPPKDVDTFVQQLGRAGRSGEQAQQIVIFNGRQCAKLSEEMIVYVRNTETCRRQLVLEFFDEKVQDCISAKHWCCDICRSQCSCDSLCDGNIRRPQSINPIEVAVRDVGATERQKLKEELQKLVVASDLMMSSVINLSFATRLSNEVISIIMKKINYIDSIDYIIDKCHVIDEDLACNILCMIDDLF